MNSLKSAISLTLILYFTLVAGFVHAQNDSLNDSTKGSLGKVNFSISCNTEVQDQFNRSVALLHNMMYAQAENEFKGVAESDPECSMAYWGISMTLFHPLWAPPNKDELQRGFDATQKALALKPATKREIAYVKAVEAFYKNWLPGLPTGKKGRKRFLIPTQRILMPELFMLYHIWPQHQRVIKILPTRRKLVHYWKISASRHQCIQDCFIILYMPMTTRCSQIEPWKLPRDMTK
jgi:hypothetical protein